MKQIIIIALLFLTTVKSYSQSVYEQSFHDIDGNTVQLNNYIGKKVLFFIAPVNDTDSLNHAHLNQLDSFHARYGDTVQIVGVLSIEDGYNVGNKATIKSMYASRGVNIILTEGVQVRKSAGTSQSALLQWLTDKNQNRHFNNDASGIGQKFFVSETGRLFAVLPPRASLQYPLIDRIVHSGMPIQ